MVTVRERRSAIGLMQVAAGGDENDRPVVECELVGTGVLFLFLDLANRSTTIHVLWCPYPADINALFALVSFATSGTYLFFLTIIVVFIERLRGWEPVGSFQLGKWGVPVTVI